MNHTTLVLLGVLVAATLVISSLAVAPAIADSSKTITKQKNKQKQKISGDFSTGAQDADNCIAVLNDANACREQGEGVTPPGPPPPPVDKECSNVLPTTVFDVTLTEASGDFPVGTVICLLKPGQNSPQASPPGAAIIPPSGSPLTGQTVRIDNSVRGGCPQGVTARVDSGNPPGTFDIGDTACITIST
jgi:hypothetical protein